MGLLEFLELVHVWLDQNSPPIEALYRVVNRIGHEPIARASLDDEESSVVADNRPGFSGDPVGEAYESARIAPDSGRRNDCDAASDRKSCRYNQSDRPRPALRFL
jgi:hypothetical protein